MRGCLLLSLILVPLLAAPAEARGHGGGGVVVVVGRSAPFFNTTRPFLNTTRFGFAEGFGRTTVIGFRQPVIVSPVIFTPVITTPVIVTPVISRAIVPRVLVNTGRGTFVEEIVPIANVVPFQQGRITEVVTPQVVSTSGQRLTPKIIIFE